mmetsp:Transcript_64394/g.158462  ORF Transcript_64394/g.158462 Transcript_64394/m.158462 type:complete len:654 (+) Transcript_64394:101-2062(+)
MARCAIRASHARLWPWATIAQPRHADTFFNIGLVRFAGGDLEGSIVAIDKALKLPSGKVHHSQYHHQMGVSMCKLAESRNDLAMWDTGIRHLAQSVSIEPTNVFAWAAAATHYMAMGYQSMAMRLTDCAARLNPGADALAALAVNYQRVHRMEQAVRAFTQALALQPDRHRSRVELFHCLCTIADWRNYEGNLRAVTDITQSQIKTKTFTFLQPFDALAHPFHSVMVRDIASSYAQDSFNNIDPSMKFSHSSALPSPTHVPGKQPRLKIGYVSADWLEASAVGRAIGSGIAKHDRDVVEVTCYGLRNQRNMDDRSYVNGLRVTCEHFVSLSSLSDFDAALAINRAGINILVNMNGYTASARTEIFAYTPAPVQTLMQGYAGTSGADFISHNLADRIQSPPEHAAFYTEKLQLLPVSAFRGEGDGDEPILDDSERRAVRLKVGLPTDCFVAANLNRPFKVEPRIFGAWMRLLEKAPDDTRMWMFRWPEALPAERNMLREAANYSHNAAEKLVFTDLLHIDQRVRGKGLADLFLDTPEYNAHGTATEVLAAGVPVLTLPGSKAHSSRVAASVVLSLRSPELVARTLQDYEAIAERLMSSKAAFSRVKRKLLSVRQGHALFDRRWWAHLVERSYAMIWDVAHAGHAHFHVIVKDDS